MRMGQARAGEGPRRGRGGFFALATAAALAAVVVLVAQGHASVSVSQYQYGPPSGGRALFRMSNDFDYTDPALAYLTTSWQAEYATCAMLVNYPDTGSPVLEPDVAAGLPTVSSNGLTYTFTIRPGLRFSDGSALTVDDVAWTFLRTLAPTMHSPAQAFASDIAGASAYSSGAASSISGMTVSGSTLSFTLTHASGAFLARVAMPFFCIVPHTLAVNPAGAAAPPTAGPYYIFSRTAGSQLVLRRNPNYLGSRQSNLDEIDYMIGGTDSAIEAAVKAGTADYAVTGLPNGDYQSVHDDYGAGSPAAAAGHQQFFVNPLQGFEYLALNTSRPRFADARLRRAVAYAVERPALIAAVGAYGGTATDQYLTPGIPGYVDGSLYPLNGPDLAIARALAAQAGVSQASPVSADLYTSNSALGLARGQLIHDELAQIGINVLVHSFSRAEQIQREGTRGEPFDIGIEGWVADYADPFDIVNVLLNGETIGPSNNNNISYFNDPTYNPRMDSAATLSGQPRADAYTGLDHDLVQLQSPLVALYTLNSRDFFSARIGCQTFTTYGMDIAGLCVRPTISGFSPTSGPVGSTVTISGSNFSGATDVSLCLVSTSYTVVNATTVTAQVPAGACDGRWRVTTPNGTAASDGAFTVG
jgi:oligopeptide transport system substrate-binding protein